MTPDLAVVTVTYNNEADIGLCLDSVAEIEGLAVEMVIVDNASTDRTVETIEGRPPSPALTVDPRPENLGFGRAMNRAVAKTTAPLVLLLNPDAALRPGCAERLVELARARPEHGFYSGLTVRSDGTLNEHTLRGLPSLVGTAMFGLGLSTLFPRLSTERVDLPDEISTVPMVTASLLLVERSLWDRLGGFDERFFMYSEDADLCRRAVDAGSVPLVDPAALIVHDGGASTPDTGKKIALMMAGRTTYIRLHWTGPARALALASVVSGVALRAAAGLRRRERDPWVKAWRLRRWWFPGYRPGHPELPPEV